jgi:hypothetical protein
MPHDVKLSLRDGSTQWVTVPLASMHGHKPVPDDWIVAEPWPWVQPKTTVTVQVPAPAESATLDPKGRTPDVNRLNNSTDFPLRIRFLRAPASNWSQYELGVRPLAAYAHDFGFGIGAQARGQYFMGEHALRYMVTLWPEVLLSDGEDPALDRSNLQFVVGDERFDVDTDVGTWFMGLDYEVRYESPLDALGPRSTVTASAAKHLGLLENRIRVRKPLHSPLSEASQTVSASVRHQWNPSDRVFGSNTDTVVLYQREGRSGAASLDNPFLRSHLLSTTVGFAAAANGDRIRGTLEVGSSLDEEALDLFDDATNLRLEARKTSTQGPVTLQADLQVGVGAGDLVRHKQFRLGGRPTEQVWRNDTFRQTSAAFDAPKEDAHLAAFGPAGPVAYLRRTSDGSILQDFRGSNMLAGRLSAEVTPLASVNALSPLSIEVFSGVGSLWSHDPFLVGFDADGLVGDAGFGASYALSQIPHLDRWTAQSDVLQGLDVVAKFPIWASDPAFIDTSQDEFAFRWLIGVEL